MPGLAGLEPMPRNRALLSLRAENSVKYVLGAKIAASLTQWISASSMVFSVTAVTLTGTFCLSSGVFWAVTVTAGIDSRIESSCDGDEGDVGAGVCAITDTGSPNNRTATRPAAAWRCARCGLRSRPGVRVFVVNISDDYPPTDENVYLPGTKIDTSCRRLP